jgi:hypothetical protein
MVQTENDLEKLQFELRNELEEEDSDESTKSDEELEQTTLVV